MKLKICGMKYPLNILEVACLQPDYMGFIFYEKSPRYSAGEIPDIASEIKKTGVFVNAPSTYILEKTAEHQLQAVQLHGEETPEVCRLLKKEGYEVIKVFSVKENFDFTELIPYEEVVDYFLFDTYGKSRGGTGKTFNWELLKDYPSEKPFFLSGGIGLEETGKIEELYRHFRSQGKEHLLYGVDVNSRFEREPGEKIIDDLVRFKEELSAIN